MCSPGRSGVACAFRQPLPCRRRYAYADCPHDACLAVTLGPVKHCMKLLGHAADTTLQFKTVNPVGDRVFIKVDTSDEVTIGGIVLPASAQKKPTQGQVVSAPKGKGVAVCGDYDMFLLHIDC